MLKTKLKDILLETNDNTSSISYKKNSDVEFTVKLVEFKDNITNIFFNNFTELSKFYLNQYTYNRGGATLEKQINQDLPIFDLEISPHDSGVTSPSGKINLIRDNLHTTTKYHQIGGVSVPEDINQDYNYDTLVGFTSQKDSRFLKVCSSERIYDDDHDIQTYTSVVNLSKYLYLANPVFYNVRQPYINNLYDGRDDYISHIPNASVILSKKTPTYPADYTLGAEYNFSSPQLINELSGACLVLGKNRYSYRYYNYGYTYYYYFYTYCPFTSTGNTIKSTSTTYFTVEGKNTASGKYEAMGSLMVSEIDGKFELSNIKLNPMQVTSIRLLIKNIVLANDSEDTYANPDTNYMWADPGIISHFIPKLNTNLIKTYKHEDINYNPIEEINISKIVKTYNYRDNLIKEYLSNCTVDKINKSISFNIKHIFKYNVDYISKYNVLVVERLLYNNNDTTSIDSTVIEKIIVNIQDITEEETIVINFTDIEDNNLLNFKFTNIDIQKTGIFNKLLSENITMINNYEHSMRLRNFNFYENSNITKFKYKEVFPNSNGGTLQLKTFPISGVNTLFLHKNCTNFKLTFNEISSIEGLNFKTGFVAYGVNKNGIASSVFLYNLNTGAFEDTKPIDDMLYKTNELFNNNTLLTTFLNMPIYDYYIVKKVIKYYKPTESLTKNDKFTHHPLHAMDINYTLSFDCFIKESILYNITASNIENILSTNSNIMLYEITER